MTRSIWSDDRGTAVIEMAFVAPLLALIAFGGFEASRMVARNTELQSAAAEAAAIVLASSPDTEAERSTIEGVIESSTKLAPEKVTLAVRFRCGVDGVLTDVVGGCATAAQSKFIQVRIMETYTPIWTTFGFGRPVNFDIKRKVQIG